ncbi:hypothetical protein [Paenibacillus sp. HJGM_3]
MKESKHSRPVMVEYICSYPVVAVQIRFPLDEFRANVVLEQ